MFWVLKKEALVLFQKIHWNIQMPLKFLVPKLPPAVLSLSLPTCHCLRLFNTVILKKEKEESRK